MTGDRYKKKKNYKTVLYFFCRNTTYYCVIFSRTNISHQKLLVIRKCLKIKLLLFYIKNIYIQPFFGFTHNLKKSFKRHNKFLFCSTYFRLNFEVQLELNNENFLSLNFKKYYIISVISATVTGTTISSRETVPSLTPYMGKKTVSVLAHYFLLPQRANLGYIYSSYTP